MKENEKKTTLSRIREEERERLSIWVTALYEDRQKIDDILLAPYPFITSIPEKNDIGRLIIGAVIASKDNPFPMAAKYLQSLKEGSA